MSEDLRIPPSEAPSDEDEGISLLALFSILGSDWKLLTLGPFVAGLLALGISYLIPPTYTAMTSLLPPQQQQSAATAALSQLGALAGLAGAGSLKNPADQYIALMQSTRVADRLVDQFKLMDVYATKYRFEARKALASNVRITAGKKDGLISIEVDDHSPNRAAEIANQYIAELRQMTNDFAITEAQQRRAFFEQHLKATRDQLTNAQRALEASGFNAGALKAEPRAAAENYARLSAEIVATQVRLQTLRRGLTDTAPEVQQQQAALDALRSQIARSQAPSGAVSHDGSDYTGKYREFKYQEALFDLFSRQYELARLDESREGALIQVVDVAQVPEWKSKPKRAVISIVAALAAFLLLIAALGIRYHRRRLLRGLGQATSAATAKGQELTSS